MIKGLSRAQVHLRKILDAPGVNAYTPSRKWNSFLERKEAFDEDGNIINEGTVKSLKPAWIIL